MNEKINYHLTCLFSELKQIASASISNSIGQALDINKEKSPNCQQALLTTDELAAFLKVSKSHINKLRKKYSDFPVLNIDGSVRFRQSEVEEFFRNL
jgi:predicted DNA-binding transcriptional regulator AlpA